MAITTLFRRLEAQVELGFYVESSAPLSAEEIACIQWFVAETFEPQHTDDRPFLDGNVFEIGPRKAVETPFSSCRVAALHAAGLTKVTRVERTIRRITRPDSKAQEIAALLDPMTQEVWTAAFAGFGMDAKPQPVRTIDLLGEGEAALKRMNAELGLGMDAWDVTFYTDMFKRLGRNPTDVELFQIGNANSEHCRHWYFRGKQVIDGVEQPRSLFDLIREPLRVLTPKNAILAFRDNAGVIRGADALVLVPEYPGKPSRMVLKPMSLHITCTAETHNHPTMIAPFPGAATGAGGRIRDNMAPGRGALLGVGVAGYFVGNLHLPEYAIPGEPKRQEPGTPYATPLRILIDGIRGVHSYGNEIGEPLIGGFLRTFGQRVNGERREPLKPVLYSGGMGRVPAESAEKRHPEIGMLVVAIGGPAYLIGVGGGSASSMAHGGNSRELDFKSVQRGNAEMANRTNRVIRACVEMGENNPIQSIHDQGAGGPSNVLTELLEMVGGTIDIRKITVGDRTMSVLELWSAEFQERYGLLIEPNRMDEFCAICERERVNCELVGYVDGTGHVTLVDTADKTTPVRLDLKQILGELPAKTWKSDHLPRAAEPLRLPSDLAIGEALQKVFALPHVGSKAFVVHSVDRSVGGLVVQQQCCGPAQIAVGDVSVTADDFEGSTGAAQSIGEQPIKMLINPAAGARMALAEALLNLVSAGGADLDNVELRANWMWAAKKPGEGALLHDAVVALCEACIAVGVVPNGGKDSLSMSVEVAGELVKSPGQLVIYAHTNIRDVTRVMTPDFKHPGRTQIGFIDLGGGKNRLGGSALAQAYGQIGDESPDMDNARLVQRTFMAVQTLIKEGLITALHDRSDGGLITTIVEMCLAANCGAVISMDKDEDLLGQLFSEELGLVFEYELQNETKIQTLLANMIVPFRCLGATMPGQMFIIFPETDDSHSLYSQDLVTLRCWWEATSSRLDEEQANPETVEAERESFERLAIPAYALTFTPMPTSLDLLDAPVKPKVAILREEGTNGDRDMAAAFHAAGFEPWDISMDDLVNGRASLDDFRGAAFSGGFSFMDTFDSAKGWAGVIRFNDELKRMFNRFYVRPDTFSLGVCNGCQLMALLGWIPWRDIQSEEQPRFVQNVSQRFESRWVQTRILESPSIFFRGMAGSSFGIHVAHGEGQFFLPNPHLRHEFEKYKLTPLVYTDPSGTPTEKYPYNPNGSWNGAAAVCSPNGRNLAMMPHAERAFLLRQWSWIPEDWKGDVIASPWLRMFQNAHAWCLETTNAR